MRTQTMNFVCYFLLLLPTTGLAFHDILTISSSCDLGETAIEEDSEYTLEWNGQYPFSSGSTVCWTKFKPEFGKEVCGKITKFELRRSDLKMKMYDDGKLVHTYNEYNSGVGNYHCTTSSFAIVIEGQSAVSDSFTSSSFVHLAIYGESTEAVTIIIIVCVVVGVIGLIATIAAICVFKKFRADRARQQKKTMSSISPSANHHVVNNHQTFGPRTNPLAPPILANKNQVAPSHLPNYSMPPPTVREEYDERYFEKNPDALYGGQTGLTEPPRPVMATAPATENNFQNNYSSPGSYGFGQSPQQPNAGDDRQQRMSYAVIGPSHTRMI